MMNSILRYVTWRAVLISAVVAGTLFLLVDLLLAPAVLQVSASLMLRYFAALVMGSGVLTQTGTEILIVGAVVHYLLSFVFALVIAIVVHRWGLLVGILGGAVLGLAFYAINLYTLTVFFQWFFAINSTVIVISHVVFGAVAGGVYEMFDHYDRPLTSTGGI
ncbi:MAG: hypothetical protein LCI00_19455 [Chloroflexi bacterium]|nr:hypothetical protein [Chloroflexota bacterium]MCC6891422.1 hypothetical protein [Anaerolineae bacterium]